MMFFAKSKHIKALEERAAEVHQEAADTRKRTQELFQEFIDDVAKKKGGKKCTPSLPR